MPIRKKAHTNEKITDLPTGVTHIHTNIEKKVSQPAVVSRGRSSAGGFLCRQLLFGFLHGLALWHFLLLCHFVLRDAHVLGDLVELLVVVLREGEVLLQQVVHRAHGLAEGGDLLLQFADVTARAAAAACTAVHGCRVKCASGKVRERILFGTY